MGREVSTVKTLFRESYGKFVVYIFQADVTGSRFAQYLSSK